MSLQSRPAPARVTAAAVLTAAALGLGACTASTVPSPPAALRPGTSPAASRSTTVDVEPAEWAAARARAVTEVLRTRVDRFDAGDVAGWLAPLGGALSGPLRTAQRAVCDRMRAMEAGDLRLVTVRETSPPVPAPHGTQVEWDVRASLTYRLLGFDTTPRSFDLDLTFKADPAQPARLVLTAAAPSGRPQPWDLPGLVVRRSATSLVLAVGTEEHVQEVLSRAQTAGSRVASVWGRARPAVWVAPATDADAARLLGRSADDLSGVAAATDGPLTAGEPAGADRIVLVPGAWSSLQPDGRDVVMTHELTHVTVRASTTRSVPVWLSEGFAELVAYQPIDLPEATIVAPALDRVRSSGPPQVLPADSDFDPGTHALPAAYGLSLLALRTMADRYGTQAVVRLYRAAAGGLVLPTSQLEDRESAVDGALRSVMGSTRSALVAQWQARIRDLLQ